MSDQRSPAPVALVASLLVAIAVVGAFGWTWPHKTAKTADTAVETSSAVPEASLLADDTATSAAESSAQPAHAYLAQEDGAYVYYSVPPTAGDKAAPAGEVVRFQYLGERDGVFELEAVGEPTVATCTDPCAVVRIFDGNSIVDHFPYDPATPLGRAFGDAFAGQLTVAASSSVSSDQSVDAPRPNTESDPG